jgi:hypothetical protein
MSGAVLVHPLAGVELQALRRVKRETPPLASQRHRNLGARTRQASRCVIASFCAATRCAETGNPAKYSTRQTHVQDRTLR